ncbi:MAG TPA: glycosyltransferase family 39 protein [Candidatus Limnocylindrales bacterium]|nr:glycosyltransferase family 39 protein [Candidatus Limnocylindrales bacterium]
MGAGLAVILAGALGLRLVGIDFGRPYVYHPDEWAIGKPAMEMVRRGDWTPGLYIYPSALVYAERVLVEGIHAATGAPLDTDVGPGPGGLAEHGVMNFLQEQFGYVLAGRVAVALLGAVTVLLVFLAARQLTGNAAALAAAGALAIFPAHVLHSHYLTTDVPAGAATALTLWLALEARHRGWRWLVLSGFAAGVAASTKYNAGLVLLVPLVIHASTLTRRPTGWRGFLGLSVAIVGAAAIGFIALTPAILFDTRAVLDALALPALIYTRGHAGAEGDAAAYYLSVVGPWLGLFASAGIAIAAVRRSSGHLAVVAFTVAYFVLISIVVVRFSRNLNPMLPFLAVLVGVAIGELLRVASGARRYAVLAVILVAGISLASTTVGYNLSALRPDTRTRALEWIHANLPPGSVIVREDFTPQVEAPYDVGFAGILSNHTMDFYRSIGARYLVASSAEFERFTREGWEKGFYARLLAMPSIYDEGPGATATGPRIVIIDLWSR